MAVKYVLPALLRHIGKSRKKWSKMTDRRYVVRKGTLDLSGLDGTSSRLALGGRFGDGIHVAFVPKHCLYETHHAADALLLVCRELPESVMEQAVIPHLLEVLPRLVDVAEGISSAQVDGVPHDLAREVYVTLRVLRHMVRSMSESTIRRELLQNRANFWIDVLNKIHPPFLHPRTADAILSGANDEIASGTAMRGKAASKAAVVQRLLALSNNHGTDLRAFSAVGIARTLTSILQKVGPDVSAAVGHGILQAINAFLVRCAAIYSELEVSDFQWRIAAEVIAEFCVPLRSMFGSESFGKLFPSVQASSVLQLLLLPSAPSASPLGSPPAEMDLPIKDKDASNTERAPLVVYDVSTYPRFLLRHAYHQARINNIKTTGFLHLPLRSDEYGGDQDLNEATFVLQEERKKRKSMAVGSHRNGPSGSGNTSLNGADAAWLRPLETNSFVRRGASGDGLSAPKAIGSSWAFVGEMRHSIRAHSSAIRFVDVDLDEEIVLTASKNGSCRVWRLSTHPSSMQASLFVDSAFVALQYANDRHRAIAVEANCVHVWDVRTSQTYFRVPFSAPDALHSSTLLKVLPYRHFDLFSVATPSLSTTSTPSLSLGATVLQGSADFAVASRRAIWTIDTRTSPGVVADWRVDAHGNAWITTTALLVEPGSPAGLLAVGTTSGQIVLLDKRTGLRLCHWQALDSRVVKIQQYSPSFVLVAGADREARVWQLGRDIVAFPPRLRMVITSLPENVRASQLNVQCYADTAVLYVAASGRVFTTRLVHDADRNDKQATSSDVLSYRIDSTSILDASSSTSTPSSSTSTAFSSAPSTSIASPERPRLHKAKLSGHAIGILPLRQVVLVGADDGALKVCV
ncbi:hypothetical protein PINS_up010406 [Pythium insidiosum]|nr:hypothetical protein PINS_up010406 [Pythium insidiosum]